MSVAWSSWAVWGFAATVVLTTILAASQGVGLTRMNLTYLLGTMFTAGRDRVDPAEHPVDDVVPADPVDARVHAVFRGGADGVRDLGRVHVHLRRDAADVEAGAAEGALLEDRHLLALVAFVEDRIARSRADDGEVVMGHAGSPAVRVPSAS